MFKKEDLEAENKRLKKELQEKNYKLQKMSDLLDHKNNEIIDLVSNNFINYKKIVEIAQEQTYNNYELKIRKMEKIARENRDFYAGLTLDTQKNRTNITNYSNK